MHDLNNRLISFEKRNVLIGEQIEKREISIVIPVKNEQRGINNFLDSFFSTHRPEDYPLEIIIVDNNSYPSIKVREDFLSKGLSIYIHKCKIPGAAAARNLGVALSLGKWILFTDSDCIATKTFISGYLNLNSGFVAYSGFVLSNRNSILDKYYDSQEVLIPPKATYGTLSGIPMYVVTANAIVYKEAYQKIGGFNECYPAAGGEDEDFSMRLWQSGNIGYAPNSLIRHDYKNGISGFAKRFINYGRGAFLTEKTWKTKKCPRLFAPKQSTILNRLIAYFQFCLMLFGYWKERITYNG